MAFDYKIFPSRRPNTSAKNGYFTVSLGYETYEELYGSPGEPFITSVNGSGATVEKALECAKNEGNRRVDAGELVGPAGGPPSVEYTDGKNSWHWVPGRKYTFANDRPFWSINGKGK